MFQILNKLLYCLDPCGFCQKCQFIKVFLRNFFCSCFSYCDQCRSVLLFCFHIKMTSNLRDFQTPLFTKPLSFDTFPELTGILRRSSVKLALRRFVGSRRKVLIKSMRIAIVLNTSWNIYNFRMNFVTALLSRGYEVHTIAPVDDYTQYLREAGCIHHNVKMDSRGANPLKDSLLIGELYLIY